MTKKIERFFAVIAFGSLMCFIGCILRIIWGYGDIETVRAGLTSLVIFIFSLWVAQPTKSKDEPRIVGSKNRDRDMIRAWEKYNGDEFMLTESKYIEHIDKFLNK